MEWDYLDLDEIEDLEPAFKTDKNTQYDIDSVLKLNFNKEDCYFFDINSEERLRIWTLQIQK